MGEGRRREVTLELDLFFSEKILLSPPLAQSWRRCWAAPLRCILIQPSLEHPVGYTLCCFHRFECKRHCSSHKIPDSPSALSLLQEFPIPPPAASSLTPHLCVVPHPVAHACLPPTAYCLPWRQGEEDAPLPSATFPILLTHPFHMAAPLLPQTPLDIGSETLFLSFSCATHLCLPAHIHVLSLCLSPSPSSTSVPGEHSPGLPLGRGGIVVRVQDKPEHPPFLGMCLCHKQGVPGHYCRAAAVSGDVTCGLSPWHAFYAAFKQASLPPINAWENWYQMILA